MKKIINTLFTFLIMGIVVIFVIGYIFNGSIAGGKGLFQGIGNMLFVSSSNKVNSIPELDSKAASKTPPVLIYKGSSQNVDDSIAFKSLFTVKTENGEKNGAVEDDFTIYLSDIRSGADVSVIEFLTAEQIEALEEIPAAFIYEEETDILHCYQSGVYTVHLKIYGSNGTQAEYEFSLPVEAQ